MMALETLKKLEKIGEFKIIRKRGDLSWDEFDEKRKEFPINITEEKGMISFKIQEGPIKEHGVNGCQVDTLIHTAVHMISGLNQGQYECHENHTAVHHLKEALRFMEKRKQRRIAEQTEGTSQGDKNGKE